MRFAVERRLGEQPDYWDHATMLELAVLDNDIDGAGDHLANALASIREPWEPKTTAKNMRLIERARKERGIETSWLLKIMEALEPKNP